MSDMSEVTALERRYRRVLACYPRSFQRENAEEILAVLLDTAAPGQARPGRPKSGIWSGAGCGCGCGRPRRGRGRCGRRSR